MDDIELTDTINTVMYGYRKELERIFGEVEAENFMARMDEMFLLPLVEDEEDEITEEFIDGFASALLWSGYIKSAEDSETVKRIIKSARAIITLDL